MLPKLWNRTSWRAGEGQGSSATSKGVAVGVSAVPRGASVHGGGGSKRWRWDAATARRLVLQDARR